MFMIIFTNLYVCCKGPDYARPDDCTSCLFSCFKVLMFVIHKNATAYSCRESEVLVDFSNNFKYQPFDCRVWYR